MDVFFSGQGHDESTTDAFKRFWMRFGTQERRSTSITWVDGSEVPVTLLPDLRRPRVLLASRGLPREHWRLLLRSPVRGSRNLIHGWCARGRTDHRYVWLSHSGDTAVWVEKDRVIKTALTEAGRTGLEREAAGLAAFAAVSPSCDFDGNQIVLPKLRRWPRRHLPPVETLRHMLTPAEARETAWYRAMDALGHDLDDALDVLATPRIGFGPVHGDLTPANMRMDQHGDFCMIDLEYWHPYAPLAIDATASNGLYWWRRDAGIEFQKAGTAMWQALKRSVREQLASSTADPWLGAPPRRSVR